ncbi:MAG: glycosyltransferase family 4 protein [Terracidiphilus sp.]
MKILVIGAYPSKENPAKGIFIQHQVEALRTRGLTVDVLPIYGGRGKKKYIDVARRLQHKIRTEHYDLIHAHHVYAGILARMQWKCPVVLTHHGAEVFAEGPVLTWMCKTITRLVDGCIAVSEQCAQVLGDPSVVVIPCGVDMERFKPIPQAEARAQLGLPADRLYLLFTGEFDGTPRPMKRLDLIQEAARILQPRFPNVEILNVQNQPNERMPLFINAADVLILASESEGSPVIIKEAMACSLPIVSVDVGDVANVIRGTHNCYLCNRSAQDIAEKCVLVLERDNHRSNGRVIIQDYGLDRIASRLIEVYEACLAKNAPAGMRTA